MRAYECLYIIHPGADTSELEQTVSKYSEVVTERGGEIRKVDQWGKRQLAYPIQKLTDGNYILMRFDAEPTTIEELEFRMRVDDRVLRYMTSYDVPEGTGVSDELMQLTERKERGPRGRGRGGRGGGRFGGRGGGGGGRFGDRDDRDDRGPRPDRDDRGPRDRDARPAGDAPADTKPAADQGGQTTEGGSE